MRGVEVLQFATHTNIIVDVEAGIEYAYTATHHATFTFYNIQVRSLVHQHGVEPPALGETLLEHEVDIGIVLACGGRIDGPTALGGQSANMGGREAEGGTIASAHTGATREGVAEFGLESPLALGIPRSVGIFGREGIGMLVGKDRHMVESTGHTGSTTIGTERHIVGALDLGEPGQSLLRITERGHQGIAVTVGEMVVDGGVVGLVGILGHQVPTAHPPLCPHGAGTYPKGQMVAIGLTANGGEDGVILLILRHIATAERERHIEFLHTG